MKADLESRIIRTFQMGLLFGIIMFALYHSALTAAVEGLHVGAVMALLAVWSNAAASRLDRRHAESVNTAVDGS